MFFGSIFFNMNIRILKQLFGFSIAGIIFCSCANNVKEVVNPDTTTIIRYADVENIFRESGCFGCHEFGTGGVTYKDYPSLKSFLVTDSTRLINAITHTGAIKMPKDQPKLPDDKIQKILTWIRQGINP